MASGPQKRQPTDDPNTQSKSKQKTSGPDLGQLIHEITTTNPYPEPWEEFAAAVTQLKKFRKGAGKPEIEARLGIIGQDGSFSSGTRREDFYKLKEKLNHSGIKRSELREIDYVYEASKQRYRVTTDEKDFPRSSLSKMRIDLKDIRTHHMFFQYDCRFCIAEEQPLQVPKTLEPGWSSKRDKHRTSYYYPFWHLDLTEVTSYVKIQSDTGGLSKNKSYEVEFEFSPEGVTQLMDPQSSNAVLSTFWRAIVEAEKHIGTLVDGSGISPHFPEVKGKRVTDASKLEELRKNCNMWFPVDENNNSIFMGSMPVAFSRRHFQTVKNGGYWCSEKADGVRYLMFFYKELVYLIDRKFDFYHVPECQALYHILPSNGPTLLDGEIVRHQVENKPFYMVFDLLVCNGASYAEKTLQERLKAIRDLIITPYRKAMDSVAPSTSPTNSVPTLNQVPFSIIGKNFFPQHKIHELFSHIIESPNSNNRYYKDEKRHHPIDGIILAPDEPYHAMGTPKLFKWKYLDRISIDFKLTYSEKHNKYMFCCRGSENQGDLECRVVDLTDEDSIKLHTDLAELKVMQKRYSESSPRHHDPIVEATYNAKDGMWKYGGIRRDKSKPNHLTVVFDTMESISENIGSEEIKAVCLKQPFKMNGVSEKSHSSHGHNPHGGHGGGHSGGHSGGHTHHGHSGGGYGHSGGFDLGNGGARSTNGPHLK